MKRSNLFLALTTGCLAVASIAFAKSHFKSASVGYCTGATPGLCTVATSKAMGGVVVAGHKAKCASPNGKTVHTRDGSNNCKATLYTQTAD